MLIETALGTAAWTLYTYPPSLLPPSWAPL